MGKLILNVKYILMVREQEVTAQIIIHSTLLDHKAFYGSSTIIHWVFSCVIK